MRKRRFFRLGKLIINKVNCYHLGFPFDASAIHYLTLKQVSMCDINYNALQKLGKISM